MSSAARWSYTGTATLWPLVSRPGWSGQESFGAPEAFRCDYRADAQTQRDEKGDEYLSRLTIYTERAGIKQGDRVLLGDATATADPIAAGARRVRSVTRFGDVFERKADDFVVGTV